MEQTYTLYTRVDESGAVLTGAHLPKGDSAGMPVKR